MRVINMGQTLDFPDKFAGEDNRDAAVFERDPSAVIKRFRAGSRNLRSVTKSSDPLLPIVGRQDMSVTPVGDCTYEIERTTNVGVFASAVSELGFVGDFVVSVVPEVQTDGIVGMTSDPEANNSYETIDYALEFTSGGGSAIYSNGGSQGGAGGYALGQVHTFERVGGQFRIKRGDTTIYGPVANNLKMYFDSAVYGMGGRYRVKCLSGDPS